jgi:hypothetical protein
MRFAVAVGLALAAAGLASEPALAHGVSGGDADYLARAEGVQFWPPSFYRLEPGIMGIH